MKVLLINGSPNKEGVLTVLKEIVATFEENDVKGEILWLGKKAMQDCTVCYKCMENGQCIYGLVNEVLSVWINLMVLSLDYLYIMGGAQVFYVKMAAVNVSYQRLSETLYMKYSLKQS